MEVFNVDKIVFDKKHKDFEMIYKTFNWNVLSNLSIQQTWWKNGKNSKYSSNSYSFALDKIENKDITKKDVNKISELFVNLFSLSNKDLFCKKLIEVCSGSGDESRKITTIHSSSLCALLFFYNITKEHPIKLIINDKIVTFGEVYFEFQNNCIDGRRPSNIDVVLISVDGETLLFLESKFSEYITSCSKTVEISNAYQNPKLCQIGEKIYNSENVKKLFGENSTIIENDKNSFKIKSTENIYIEGLKQMVSHYIGAVRFSKKEYKDERSKQFNPKNIYLGTILFDNFSTTERLENYENLYSNFSNAINELFENSNVSLLAKPLKYSEYVSANSDKIDTKVREFYFGNNNN
ncbi:MAG: hypothetical protein SPL22_10685 [Treponema sp.]|uniref:hypothetical protein n=1 Tax=Treponema sp. TaxID=166 RepID=UPI002A91DAD5|nr:hypothetical protein [Treponema sp.]MDY6398181.1 hypothetical protein [Treponema sp.]